MYGKAARLGSRIHEENSIQTVMRRRLLTTCEHLLLGLVLLGYLAGALRTWLTVPLHRGPDESQHLQYVHALIDGRGLPVMRLPPEANLASQESAEPAVY